MKKPAGTKEKSKQKLVKNLISFSKTLKLILYLR